MKTIISVFIALTYSAITFAQADSTQIEQTNKQINDILDKAEFIFEGKQIEYKTFKNDSTKKNYTIYKIKISKIFRANDNLKIGTVEIIQEGANCGIDQWGNIFFIPQPHGYKSTTNGIYFCIPSGYPNSGTIECLKTEEHGWVSTPDLYAPPTNSIQLQEIGNIDYYTMKGININKEFKTKQEIYEYLKQFDNLVIPEQKPVKKKDASGSLNEKSTKNQIKYAQNVKNYDKYMEQLQIKLGNVKKQSTNACQDFFISEYIAEKPH